MRPRLIGRSLVNSARCVRLFFSLSLCARGGRPAPRATREGHNPRASGVAAASRCRAFAVAGTWRARPADTTKKTERERGESNTHGGGGGNPPLLFSLSLFLSAPQQVSLWRGGSAAYGARARVHARTRARRSQRTSGQEGVTRARTKKQNKTKQNKTKQNKTKPHFNHSTTPTQVRRRHARAPARLPGRGPRHAHAGQQTQAAPCKNKPDKKKKTLSPISRAAAPAGPPPRRPWPPRTGRPPGPARTQRPCPARGR